MNDPKDLLFYWNKKYEESGYLSALSDLSKEYKTGIIFTTSLGIEDQVLTDILNRNGISVRYITLDTGRMFYETYNLLEKTERRYNIKVEVFFPDYISVQKMVLEKGINLFYESVENRKLCCTIRKIQPLEKAMAGEKVWLTGIRADQSATRVNMKFAEWDEKFKVLKINPLLDFSLEDTWKYTKDNNVPYNPLHDEGYPSIGCSPCTRAVMPGEDIRAGRWWWENPETKECGLHIQDGQLVSIKREK